MRRCFPQFLGKFEVSEAKTNTHCCSGLYPLCVSLYFYTFIHYARRRDEVVRELGRRLAVVILCCVLNGVAGKRRSKCVKNREN